MKSTGVDKLLHTNNLSLYAHIPFCVVKCGYCDFNSFSGTSEELQSAVIDAMLHELEFRGRDLKPRTIFLGGGTPTHISYPLLKRFLEGLASSLDLSQVEEYSCEANPESASQEKLELLLQHGIHRLSLGVQSFHETHLRFLDRAHSVQDAVDAFHRARQTGFQAISLDLIYGIPGQSLDAWMNELDQAIALHPDHLSCYHLTFEPGTQLHVHLNKGLVQEIPEEQGRSMLMETRARLKAAGYPPYEISNFARPGKECLHNIHYWKAGSYLGIGPGASSHRMGIRQSNLRPLDSYLKAIQEQSCPIATAETLGSEHRCREALWLGLRLTEGVDLHQVTRLTGTNPLTLFPDLIQDHLSTGNLIQSNTHLQIPTSALPLTDRITSTFL